jgi:hypothetical protein
MVRAPLRRDSSSDSRLTVSLVEGEVNVEGGDHLIATTEAQFDRARGVVLSGAVAAPALRRPAGTSDSELGKH